MTAPKVDSAAPEDCDGIRMVGRKDWGDYPLAHEDGIAVIGAMIGLMMESVTVLCAGCGWRGRRKGGPFFAAKKPCPRCSGVLEVSERSRRRLLRPVSPEQEEALKCAEEKYDARPSYEEAHGVT